MVLRTPKYVILFVGCVLLITAINNKLWTLRRCSPFPIRLHVVWLILKMVFLFSATTTLNCEKNFLLIPVLFWLVFGGIGQLFSCYSAADFLHKQWWWDILEKKLIMTMECFFHPLYFVWSEDCLKKRVAFYFSSSQKMIWNYCFYPNGSKCDLLICICLKITNFKQFSLWMKNTCS